MSNLARRDYRPNRKGAFSAEAITRALFYLLLVTLPFQVLAVPIATTRIDISNIVFLVIVAWVVVLKSDARATLRFKITFAIFIAVEVANFIFVALPISRFLSSFVWIGSIALFFGYRAHVQYSVRVAYYCVLGGVICAALVCLYQLFVLEIARPAGLMSEPSPAGLLFLSALAGTMISFRSIRSAITASAHLLLGVILLYISYRLKTTHFVSFAISITAMGLIMRLFDWRTVLVAAGIMVAVYFILNGDAHYLERFDLSASRITNISLLAWLQGWDQMWASLHRFPVFGAGLGGTGYFYFYSPAANQLALYNLADLNRFDAFSGFFRLIIELGPVFALLLLGTLYLHLRRFALTARRGYVALSPEETQILFLMTFALTMIIGTLIKEPTWSRSTVVGSMALFISVPYAATPGVFGLRDKMRAWRSSNVDRPPVPAAA